MATPTSREELKQYALRKLGAPVIEINVDDAQLEDALDDSLQIFNEYHFDGVQKALFKVEVSESDITNGYLETNNIGITQGPGDSPQVEAGDRIVSVNKVFQFAEGGASTNMFSVNYQLALNDIYGIRTPGSLSQYANTQSYIQMVSDMLDPEKQIEFSRVTNRLYLKMDWSENVSAGDFLMVEAYVSLNPDTYTEIYNDILLKQYVTASFKKQWAMNLLKYQNIRLPGGVEFNADSLLSEANSEMDRIEQTLYDKYELPPDIMMG